MKFIIPFDFISSTTPNRFYSRTKIFGKEDRFWGAPQALLGPYEDETAIKQAIYRLSKVYHKMGIKDVKFFVFDGLMLDMEPLSEEKPEAKKDEQKKGRGRI